MADGLKCPVMKWDTGDDQHAVEAYKLRLDRWFVIKNVQDDNKHNYIVYQAGDKGEELAETWQLTAEELKNPDNVWTKLRQSVGTSENFRVHRLNFMNMRQETSESIDEFYARCTSLAMKCKFGSLDERIIDQLVVGTRVGDSRKELLKKDEKLTVEDALDTCRTQEASIAHMKAFDGPDKTDAKKVDAIRSQSQNPRKDSFVTDCQFCGRDHPYGRCPAYFAKCANCGRKGHWKQCCRDLHESSKGGTDLERGRSSQNGQSKGDKRYSSRHRSKSRGRTNAKQGGKSHDQKKVHSVEFEDDFEGLCFDSITSNKKFDNEDIMVHVDVKIPSNKPAELYCKIDTGAQGNVLPLRTFQKMFPEHLNDDRIPVPGSFVVKQPFV